jgi:hypothetical protein
VTHVRLIVTHDQMTRLQVRVKPQVGMVAINVAPDNRGLSVGRHPLAAPAQHPAGLPALGHQRQPHAQAPDPDSGHAQDAALVSAPPPGTPPTRAQRRETRPPHPRLGLPHAPLRPTDHTDRSPHARRPDLT